MKKQQLYDTNTYEIYNVKFSSIWGKISLGDSLLHSQSLWFLLILPCMENISYEKMLEYPIQGGYYATKQITGQKHDLNF